MATERLDVTRKIGKFQHGELLEPVSRLDNVKRKLGFLHIAIGGLDSLSDLESGGLCEIILDLENEIDCIIHEIHTGEKFAGYAVNLPA